jgi:PAS domain S-box-containing protein
MNFEEEQLNKIVSSIALILNNDHSVKAINTVGLQILNKTGRQLIGKKFNPVQEDFKTDDNNIQHFSSLQWANLIEVIPMPVFVKDRQHRWIIVNEALCRLQNMTKEQLLNKTDYDFFPQNQADKFWKEEEVVFETSKELFTEEPSIRNDQESYVLIKKTLFRTDSGQDFLVGCCIDITERKKAELALIESERRFRSLIQNSPDLILILDKNTCVKYVTPSFERLFGYPQKEMLNVSLVKLVHTDDVYNFLKQFSEVSNFGKDLVAEIRLKKRNGEFVILECFLKNLYYDPAVNGVVINASNVTTIRKQEQEIEQMNSLLQRDNMRLQVDLRHEVEARVELKPLALDDFKKLYPDEESCLLSLAKLKWKEGFKCSKCKYPKFSEGKSPYGRRCTKCGYDESATTNTFYYRCKFPLVKAFYMVSLIRFDKKITAKKLSELTGVRIDTCTIFKRKVLSVMFKDDKPLSNWDSLIINTKKRVRKANRVSTTPVS